MEICLLLPSNLRELTQSGCAYDHALVVDAPWYAYALFFAGRHEVQDFWIIIVLRRRMMVRIGDGELA